MQTVIVTMRSTVLCMANSYFDNKKRSMCSINTYCNIMTITGRSMCSAKSYLTITGRSICSVSSYCDNNGDGYM